METLKVKLVAHKNEVARLFENGKSIIENRINPSFIEYTNDDADLLFFLSGGSEVLAIEDIKSDAFIILLAGRPNNAFASAMEVKAWMDIRKIPNILLSLEDSSDGKMLNEYTSMLMKVKNLKAKKLGLIGSISEWLIASDIEAKVLKTRLGITLKNIPWNRLPIFQKFRVSNDFIQFFNQHPSNDLEDASRIYQLLKETIEHEHLDAISVECFSLIKEFSISACLPLSKFNNDGIPAGCEGDLTSITGMMIAKEVCGRVPWMANCIDISENRISFAHCTIATNLVDKSNITTHFETNIGLSIKGRYVENKVTIFRIDSQLKHFFITTATVIDRPVNNDACRTQIVVEPDSVLHCEILKKHPLGNHHLILNGDFQHELNLFFSITDFKQVTLH